MPQELLFFPGLGALIAVPYVTARITRSDNALRDAVSALVRFVPLAYLLGPVGALGVAAGLSSRNEDRLRWLAVLAFVLVAAFAFFGGAPVVAQAALALFAYPIAVLRPSALVHR